MTESPAGGKVRSRSPDTPPGSERKRRRKVLSCYECRRRKLQCDRAMPVCGRCTKSGQPNRCLYIDDAPEAQDSTNVDGQADSHSKGPFEGYTSRLIQAPPSAGDTLSRLEYQKRRIKQLEEVLARASGNQAAGPPQRTQTTQIPLTPDSAVNGADHGKVILDRESMLLRGKSFKTQFFGSTHPSGLIAHMPDLSVFTKETFENYPALARIRHDMESLEDRIVYAGSQPHTTSNEELKALLPTKMEADQLVKLFMDNYGYVYHIFHLPSFWREYSELWSDVQAARAHFVAIVLLITAAAQCLSSRQPTMYLANSSAGREKAGTIITACEDWLRGQSQKHVTVSDFQIRFLILLARQVSAQKYKRAWTEVGTFLRFSMSAGLHRNPDLMRKSTTTLDKELRRRMWAAIVEMELQSSFDRGMISASWPLQTDCPSPSNIADEDIDDISKHNPIPRRSEELTTASYLVTASESAILRHTLNTKLNSIRHTLSFDDIKRYTNEIEAHLAKIPQWTGANAEVPKALASLRLRQYLLALHDRQSRQAETRVERSFSRMIIVENAARMIDTHRALLNKGCHALEVLCFDPLRAALSMCYVANSIDVRTESTISGFFEHQASRIMDEAVEMLTDKVLRFGREQRQLWIAVAAHGFCKAKRNPGRRAAFMQEAVDKVTRPYYKIMACQEDTRGGATGADTAAQGQSQQEKNGDAHANLMDYIPQFEPSRGDLGDLNDPSLIDWDEIGAWTFDLYHNPGTAVDLDHSALNEPYQSLPTQLG